MRPTQLILLVALAVLAGCAPQYTTPVVDMRPKTEAQLSFEAYWRASLEVLRKHNFKINLQDRRRGLITTEPLVAKQFFEFWRRDAATTYDLAEGSLQTVYIVATISLTRPDEAAPDYVLAVTVDRIRSDKIERRWAGPACSDKARSDAKKTGGDREYENRKGSMVGLGEDDALALQLRADIEHESAYQMAELSYPGY